MRLRVVLVGIVLVGASLSSCMEAPSLVSSDPAKVAEAALVMLEAIEEPAKFGSTPDTVYYGSGCTKDQDTSVLLYLEKPETWFPEPAAIPPIVDYDFIANWEFLNDDFTGAKAGPQLTFGKEPLGLGYVTAVLDLSGYTFTGKEGWLHFVASMDVTRLTTDTGGLVPSFGGTYHEASSYSSGPIAVRVKPCGKVPLDLIFTGLLPSPDPRFKGTISVSPDSVRMPSCTPNTITVTYKPDAGPGLATSEPIEYWAVFTYTPSSSTTSFGDTSYRMSWDGTAAAWKAEVPVGYWSTITEAGTVKTRVEVVNAGAPSSPVMYSLEAPGTVALGLCPMDLVFTCPPDRTLVETSSSGTLLPTPLPAPTTFSTCGPVTVNCAPSFGSPFPAGITEVVCEAKNDCGETAKCDTLVMVSKAPPLVITCPSSLSVTASSAAGATVTYAAPTASGGCGTPSITCAPPSGSTFPIGTTPVTCTAFDACSTTATCNFAISVGKPRANPTPADEPNPPPFSCGQIQDQPTCDQQYGNICHWDANAQPPACVSN